MSGVGSERAVESTGHIAVSRRHFGERHGCLVEVGSQGMVVFEAEVPFEAVVPAVAVLKGQLVATAGGGIIE